MSLSLPLFKYYIGNWRAWNPGGIFIFHFHLFSPFEGHTFGREKKTWKMNSWLHQWHQRTGFGFLDHDYANKIISSCSAKYISWVRRGHIFQDIHWQIKKILNSWKGQQMPEERSIINNMMYINQNTEKKNSGVDTYYF